MPHSVSFTPDDTARLHDTLTALIDSGGSPGGVVVAGTTAGQREVLTAGIVAPECGDQAPDEHTVYDIASLTKVVATWPLIGRALRDGLIELDAPIRDFLPAFSGEAPSGEATVRQLLAHTSGLRASTRLDQYRNTGTPLHELMCKEPLGEQPGQHRYINRGFILLGLALAHINQRPLHELARQHWAPIRMPATTYGPVTRTPQVAPTEQILAGAPRIWGGPHDDNAALLGGVAGHAGVFSTPADLAALAGRLLRHYATDDSSLGQLRGIGYVLAVACSAEVPTGAGRFRADALARKVPKRAWQKLSAGRGAKGQRFLRTPPEQAKRSGPADHSGAASLSAQPSLSWFLSTAGVSGAPQMARSIFRAASFSMGSVTCRSRARIRAAPPGSQPPPSVCTTFRTPPSPVTTAATTHAPGTSSTWSRPADALDRYRLPKLKWWPDTRHIRQPTIDQFRGLAFDKFRLGRGALPASRRH